MIHIKHEAIDAWMRLPLLHVIGRYLSDERRQKLLTVALARQMLRTLPAKHPHRVNGGYVLDQCEEMADDDPPRFIRLVVSHNYGWQVEAATLRPPVNGLIRLHDRSTQWVRNGDMIDKTHREQARQFAAFVPPRKLDFATYCTTEAVALAHGIYDEKAFDRFPILADALEEAGYDDAVTLTDLRTDDPYIACRGYWLLDALTGRLSPAKPQPTSAKV